MNKFARTGCVMSLIGLASLFCCSKGAVAKAEVITDTSGLPSFVKDEIPKDAAKVIRFDTTSGRYSFIAIYRNRGKGKGEAKLIAYLKERIPAMIWTNKWLPVTDYEFEEVPSWKFSNEPIVLIRRHLDSGQVETIVAGLKGANLIVLSSLKGKGSRFVAPSGDNPGVLRVEVPKKGAGKGEEVSYTWNGTKIVEVES